MNTASRMESNSMPGMIHCSYASAQLLETQAPEIPLKLRGMIKIKGKGKMKTYWVGDDDLVKKTTPLSSMTTQTLNALCEECNEEDSSHDLHRQEEYSNHSDGDTEPSSCDEIGVSIRTEYTVISDSLSDSGGHHPIKVQCSLTKKSKKRIDETLKGIDSHRTPVTDMHVISLKI